jgi:S-adenosylmethionine hydrolase
MSEHECKDCQDKKEQDNNLNIRIDIADKFYEKMDNIIDELYKEHNISYGEIELAMLKMNEKILQQKITLMHQYLHSEDSEVKLPDKKEPSGVYG